MLERSHERWPCRVGTVTEQHRPFTGRSDDAVRTQHEPLGYTIKRLHKKKGFMETSVVERIIKGKMLGLTHRGRYRKQLQPTSLACDAPASPFWKATL